MDTTIIENTQVVNVFVNLGATAGIFNQTIDINFIPDMMILKTVQYDAAVPENGVTTIYTNIVNNQICSFVDGVTSNPETRFLIYNKPVRGTYNFKVLDSTGLVNAARAGTLYIQLEFVKYRRVPEQKMY